MSSSPVTFLDLPTELKCRIMEGLDIQSLLRMSLTSRSTHEVIYASEALVLDIELAKSDLLPAANIGSTPMARRLVEAHIDARLNLPLPSRPCVTFPAPITGVRRERLFRGFLTCITEEDELYIWNIHDSNSQHPVTLHVPNLIDLVIEPDHNLLALLCRRSGDNVATIKLRTLSSSGVQAHPLASSPIIVHTLPPGESLEYHQGQQLLTHSNDLLALAYHKTRDLESRRGIIWTWRTGETVYDSKNFPSWEFHDLLLLHTPMTGIFLVTVSTFLINHPGVSLGAWIELRRCGSATTPAACLALFALPEFLNPALHCLGSLDFYSSEPPPIRRSPNIENFPFCTNPSTGVHVLNVWYKSRPGVNGRNGSRIYLIISNLVFLQAVTKSSQVPITQMIQWHDWGPRNTAMWSYEKLGLLCGTSSVCGRRICTVSNPEDDEFEVLIVDFNMNIPCRQRKCTGPAAHLRPQSFGPDDSPWAHVEDTWLPFHSFYRNVTVSQEDGMQVICNSVLMDEEFMVFSTCADLDPETVLDPTSWKVVHLLREPIPWGSNCFMPAMDYLETSTQQHDQICRMCKTSPHTDEHILLECTANPFVVNLREYYLPNFVITYPEYTRPFFDLLMVRRDMTIPISHLVGAIKEVYRRLDQCSEPVQADRENPASVLFVIRDGD